MTSGEEFDRIYVKYYRYVYKIVYNMLINKSYVEDVVQNIFTKIAYHFPNFESEPQEKTWIITVTKSTTLDFIKSQSRLKNRLYYTENESLEYIINSLEEPSCLASISASPESSYLTQEGMDAITNAINNLSERDSSIFLRYYEGENVKEMALQLGVHYTSLYREIKRITAKLRKALSEYFYEKGAY